MARTDAVDAHDPPAWMRELVILRDRHCVFPWCNRDARACDSTTSLPTRRTVHRARPGPTPSPPCVEDTTARRPSADGATTAPPPATTSGPDPTARPTWSPRPAPVDLDRLSPTSGPEEVAKQPSRRARHRNDKLDHRPPTTPGDPACPAAAAGAGRRGVLRRRSVKATRGGTPRNKGERPADGDASRRGEPSAADVVRRTAPNHPQPTVRRTARTTRSRRGTPHSPEPPAADVGRGTSRSRPERRTAPNHPSDPGSARLAE